MKKEEAYIEYYKKMSWENTYKHFGCDCINQIHLALSVPQHYYDIDFCFLILFMHTSIPAEYLIKLSCPTVYKGKIHWIFMALISGKLANLLAISSVIQDHKILNTSLHQHLYAIVSAWVFTSLLCPCIIPATFWTCTQVRKMCNEKGFCTKVKWLVILLVVPPYFHSLFPVK